MSCLPRLAVRQRGGGTRAWCEYALKVDEVDRSVLGGHGVVAGLFSNGGVTDDWFGNGDGSRFLRGPREVCFRPDVGIGGGVNCTFRSAGSFRFCFAGRGWMFSLFG